MALNSDDINLIVYRYLQESGFEHSAFTFNLESRISNSNIYSGLIPVGALISIIQKGMFYIQAEINVGEDVNDHHLNENLSLIDAVMPETVASRRRNRQMKQGFARNEENQNKEDTEKAITDSTEIIKLSSSFEIPSLKYTVLKGHNAEAFLCSWCPTTDIVASGSGDGTARIWDITDNEFTRPPLILNHYMKKTGSDSTCSKDVTTLDWKFDGKLLATGSYDGYARIWHRDGRISRTLGKHKGPIFAMKWNKNAKYIVSAGMDQTTYIWDMTCSHYNKEINFHSGTVLDVDWRTDDCYATCGIDTLIHVCQIDYDEPVKTFKGHTNEVNIIKWNPEGNLLASCSDDITLKIWSMNQDTYVHDLRGHTKEIYTMKWSPTGPGSDNPNMNLILASASYDANIVLWDAERGEHTRILNNHTNPIYGLAFSPDGKYLASGSDDGIIYVWSMQDYSLVHSFQVSAAIYEVCWNCTSKKLCASSADGQLHILDLRKP